MEAKPAQPPVIEQPEFEMKLVLKDEIPEAADVPKLTQPVAASPSAEELAMQDDAEDQKRRLRKGSKSCATCPLT